MQKKYLLENKVAEKLYKETADMPIIDYHCHLSPKEIYEDKVFDNIGEMWLIADHYKWRLMRTVGIDEYYITGAASLHDKFIKYAEALEFAAGNPLYYWSHMELSMYFGIEEILTLATAESIWNRANAAIKDKNLSPRKLIEQSNVEIICTTDDIIDNLEWHSKIREENKLKTKILPSFRTDTLLLMHKKNYCEYIEKLSEVSETEVKDLPSLKIAVQQRLEFFVQNGCVFTDVGIPHFPDRISNDEEANNTFKSFLKDETVNNESYMGLIGHLYLWLGRLYKKHGLIMQWHLAAYRNANSKLFAQCGLDCGVDCIGNQLDGESLIYMLDALNKEDVLPETILYTLNPSNIAQIASIAGSFPGVRIGAAWWFCDHKRGIIDTLETICENSSIGNFLGMLTDSRSFLSYARHDYCRRILCSLIGKWVEKGEFAEESAKALIKKINYKNLKELAGK